MIRTIALALLCAAAPAAAAERSYPVTDFDRVEVQGPYEVTLVTGRSSSARVIGSAQALESVSIDVQGSQLRVRRNASAWGGYPGERAGPVRIEISTRDLRAVSVIGGGKVSVDRVRGLRADLSVSGSGRIEVARIEADNLIIGLLGSGRIAAAGSAKQVRATVQGSGDLAAPALTADDLTLVAETAGDIAISARRTAKLRTGGSGDVAIGGTATCTVTGAGTGSVRCGKGGPEPSRTSR